MATAAADVVSRFYAFLLEADFSGAGALLADGVVIEVPGRSPLARTYTGRAEALDAWERMHQLSGGTLRAYSRDSSDVAASEYHTVVMDRLVAERDGRTLDSSQAWVFAVSEGRIVRGFAYIYDLYAFDEFWS